jgi:hypothetical protein
VTLRQPFMIYIYIYIYRIIVVVVIRQPNVEK